MVREMLTKNQVGLNQEFRFRGQEPGRLENFSDAVFALAITLLLISTSPPSNFEQVKRFAFDLIPFLLCIVLIITIWYEHYIFFLRYGLRNGKIVVLNTLFLVIVLFYVYPLKFLTKLVLFPIAFLVGQDSILLEMKGMIRGQDIADLMIIYGLGAAAVFLVLRWMYVYAYRQAEALELTEIEQFDTRTKIRTNTLMAAVPLLSVLMAILFHSHWIAGLASGMTYFLYTPIMIVFGKRVDRNRKKLLERLHLESITSVS
jgi:uncharacterized membrane protein